MELEMPKCIANLPVQEVYGRLALLKKPQTLALAAIAAFALVGAGTFWLVKRRRSTTGKA